jgi:hypothetical protein
MAEKGQKQPYRLSRMMSGFPPKADIRRLFTNPQGPSYLGASNVGVKSSDAHRVIPAKLRPLILRELAAPSLVSAVRFGALFRSLTSAKPRLGLPQVRERL